ncbi:Outer membrane protein OmpA [Salegentibacter salinarum]|nr:OmpA family protein [Salegentibacter salinarum]SKC01208.1 Outer membrane protein OmpA [Salegentibacter salinarum]
MNKNYQYLYLLLLFFSISSIEAQEAKLDMAEKKYENYGYINAREIYLKVAEKGFESEELFQRLGNSYYFNAAYSDALVWYTKLFSLNEDQEEKYLRRYAQSLQATGNSKKAESYYNLFQEKDGLTAEDYLYLIERNSGRYSIQKLKGINTNGREFGHSFKNGKLIYASTQDTGVFVKRKNSWDGLSFLNLYEVELKQDSLLGKPKKLKSISGKYHESSATLSENGKTLYFTRSNNNKNQNQYLKIYRAELNNGKWKNLEDLSINIQGYSTAHPTLDKEEEYLYFASDRPGGFGESDIYRAAIHKDGSLSEPENLGPEINTKGKETFPFISNNSELYFSSDGHFGLGGLDVFYVKMEGSEVSNILNIGRPINSYADDFSFGVNQKTKQGFFSSNRKENGTFGYDNIYTLKEKENIQNAYKAIILGKVLEEDTGEPLVNASVKLYTDGKLYDSIATDGAGNYSIAVNYFSKYRLQADKEDYDSKEKFNKPREEEQEINFSLRRNTLALVPGTDISSLLNIKNILFDFDMANIRSDAQIELEKLLMVMQDYPDLKLEIRSHTDSRGSDSYNKALSERRAQSTKRYLIEKGISEQRLKAKGFGEERLLNDCGNGSACSSAEHQRNRRSEFIVLE